MKAMNDNVIDLSAWCGLSELDELLMDCIHVILDEHKNIVNKDEEHILAILDTIIHEREEDELG